MGDATFNMPGDSGLMIFNSRGQVVGLNMTGVEEADYMLTMETIERHPRENGRFFESRVADSLSALPIHS